MLAAATPVLAAEQEWDSEVDVVVVGAGAAGELAAIATAEAGLETVLLESLDVPISSSHLCGGYVTMCETDMVPDSREELFADLVAAAQGDCQEDLVRSYVDIAPEMYKKLVDWGVSFYTTEQVAYMSKPWAHIVEGNVGAGLMTKVEEHAQEVGVELVCGMHADRLAVDDAGRVVGLVATAGDGSSVAYGASKGVIITSGGFSHNHVLAKALGKRGSEFIVPVTGKGGDGSGLFMGLDVGADVSYLGAGVVATTPLCVNTATTSQTYMTCGGINVSLEGRRFHSEGDNYTLIVTAAMDLPKALFFQIYDDPMREVLAAWEGLATFGLPPEEDVISADTIEGLADAIAGQYPEFDAGAFLDEVARYNSFVENGLDEDFGRTNITGITGDLVTIETGPFYAVPSTIGTTHFNGGLKTDAGQRVLSAFGGEPIEGLYAAGEVTGGFHGFGYMSGSAFGKAIMHGAIAGRSLVEDNG